MSSPPHTGKRPRAPRWIPTRLTALKFALGYAAGGMLWIFGSGKALHYFVHDPEEVASIEAAKGWLFVVVTAGLLLQVLGRYFKIIRRSARLLQESESRLRSISDNLPDGYLYEYTREADGTPKLLFISAGVERVHGVSPEQAMRDANAILSQFDSAQIPAYFKLEAESAAALSDFEMEVLIHRPDQTRRTLHLRSRPRIDAGGQVRWDGVAMDVSARKQAENALQLIQELLHEVERSAKIGGWDLDPSTGEGHWTEEVERIHDLDPGVKPNKTMGLSFYTGESRTRIEAAVQVAIKQGTPYDLELELISAKGVHKWVRTICHPLIENGKVVRLHGSIQDISDRKRATEALEQYRAKLEAALASMHDAVFITDREGVLIEFNDAFASFHRFKSKADCPLDLKQYGAFLEILNVDGQPVPLEELPIPRALRGEFGENVEYVLRRKDTGESWDGSFSFAPIQDIKGSIGGVVVVGRDITEKKKALAALKKSEEDFRALFEMAAVGMGEAEPGTGRILRVNRKYCEILGYTEQELLGCRVADFTHPDDRPHTDEAFQRVLSESDGESHYEKRYIRKDGQVAWVKVNMTLIRDESGRPQRMMGAIEDITEHKRLEEQLRQSQKMDAIGQLAGGVAHDFNNILCMIRIQTELAATADNAPENIREDLDQIRAAADRAADLTRQLLLFSRRQVMQRKNLDLNAAVTNIAKMLERIIGEDVVLGLELSPKVLVAHVDPGMLDQVMMNLAINARDAMPNGGNLTLKTDGVELDANSARLYPDAAPGRYVRLEVTDTGCGMPSDVKARIFEPFFTTKPPGQGTGLGLATVFGIVKQHRGWITVESEEGAGTTFQIFLPAASAPSVSSGAAPARPKPLGGSETILLAEDDPSMRTTASMLLQRNGYKVLVASDGEKALELWSLHREEVALLLTDLVMPGGIGGIQLADELLKEKPTLKVVYTSGYSAEIAGQESRMKFGTNFLPKPFSTEQLLQVLRRELDSV